MNAMGEDAWEESQGSPEEDSRLQRKCGVQGVWWMCLSFSLYVSLSFCQCLSLSFPGCFLHPFSFMSASDKVLGKPRAASRKRGQGTRAAEPRDRR